jgi:hypothetical protein
LAAERDRPTAILVSPIHEAQIVRADDGKDHVEYELLVVNVFSEPVTLTSVTVLDPAGTELMQIEGAALAAATQTLFAKTATSVVPASAAVSVDVDLILPPDTAPERVTHRVAYTLKADSEVALMIGSLKVNAPEVTINRQPAMVIRPPLKGKGWLATTACCKPNIHRDLRVAIDGVRSRPPRPLPSTGPRSRTTDSSTAMARGSSNIMASARTSSRSPMALWSTSMTACTMRRRPS